MGQANGKSDDRNLANATKQKEGERSRKERERDLSVAPVDGQREQQAEKYRKASRVVKVSE